MAATVHSLGCSLRCCSISSGAAGKGRRQPTVAEAAAGGGSGSMQSQEARSVAASEAPASPHTPVTDAASGLDAMSMSADNNPAPPPLLSPHPEADSPAAIALPTPALPHTAEVQQPRDAMAVALSTPQRLAGGSSLPSPGLPPRTPLSKSANVVGISGGGCAAAPGNSQSRSARRRRPRRSDSSSMAADAAGTLQERLRTSNSSRRRRHTPLQGDCETHPLDGTPQSLLRHPLRHAWPSSGVMRTVSAL